MTPTISGIRIYPIKSLDPVELNEIEVGTRSLLFDREFAMLAEDGRFVNGKRTGKVNTLQARYDIKNYLVSLNDRKGGAVRTFHLVDDKQKLENFLSNFFDLPVTIIHNEEGALMDIPVESSVTLMSDATLLSLQSDMPSHSLEDLKLRFRPNLMVAGVDRFWEEELFGEPGTGIEFLVGNVRMIGISPRARCNVPPRNPLDGEQDKSFIRTMMKSRADTLPKGSKLLKYGGLYQLTVNVYIPETEKGKIFRIGDEIKVIGPVVVEVNE
ncbi:MAG TPA: MOSC N-terminal beta barrel domain-containing protein [Cyclobacteriaceae bacterium]|nr:MOSC N-terminal beta barrel domain-containing protein [Cyclobacteriaceae bacterium]